MIIEKHRSSMFPLRTLDGFDEESLRKEWFALPTDLTLEGKRNISKLNFDDMKRNLAVPVVK